MGLTDEERRRLDALADQLELDDPRLSRALTDRRRRSGSDERGHARRRIRPRRRWLSRRARGVAILVSAGATCAFVLVSIPLQQPLLFALALVVCSIMMLAGVLEAFRGHRDPRASDGGEPAP